MFCSVLFCLAISVGAQGATSYQVVADDNEKAVCAQYRDDKGFLFNPTYGAADSASDVTAACNSGTLVIGDDTENNAFFTAACTNGQSFAFSKNDGDIGGSDVQQCEHFTINCYKSDGNKIKVSSTTGCPIHRR